MAGEGGVVAEACSRGAAGGDLEIVEGDGAFDGFEADDQRGRAEGVGAAEGVDEGPPVKGANREGDLRVLRAAGGLQDEHDLDPVPGIGGRTDAFGADDGTKGDVGVGEGVDGDREGAGGDSRLGQGDVQGGRALVAGDDLAGAGGDGFGFVEAAAENDLFLRESRGNDQQNPNH